MGVRHAIDRAVAKSNDNGKLATVCPGNWKENKQEWMSLQFVSTAAVVTGMHSLFIRLGGKGGEWGKSVLGPVMAKAERAWGMVNHKTHSRNKFLFV